MKRLFLTGIILAGFAATGYCQELNHSTPDSSDTDSQIYAGVSRIGSAILSEKCLAQGGRIVEQSERCNDDEISVGKVLGAKRYCKCCRKPSSAELGGVLNKLNQYYATDSGSSRTAAPDLPNNR